MPTYRIEATLQMPDSLEKLENNEISHSVFRNLQSLAQNKIVEDIKAIEVKVRVYQLGERTEK